MADTGKQSPLGINVIGSYLLNQGLHINPVAQSYMGTSKTNYDYSFGKLVSSTCLRLLTWAIHDGYNRGALGPSSTKVPTLTTATYDNLISIGANTIPALGNAKPPTYIVEDPSGVWTDTAVIYGKQTNSVSDWPKLLPGPATSGYGNYDPSIPFGDLLQGHGFVDQKQNATWYPYNSINPNHSVTQWGYIRLHALQAWNEFNWNGTEVELTTPEYKEFLSSFLAAQSFINYTDQVIQANQNAKTFLDGAYSNMDDLISADIYGVNLANTLFGTDLEKLGKVLNLSRIDSFGLPSVLLQTLGENNAVIQDLVLALLSSGLASDEVQGLISGAITTPTIEQEQKIYSAFLIIIGENLQEILAPLQCTTQGLKSLADLLDVKKILPNSYRALSVPKYNSELGLPTNSKTYYPLYKSGGLNESLTTETMNDYVGTQTPKRPPKIVRNRTVNSKNITAPKRGFGSYLYDILPRKQAVAAGAFSFAMRQVKNIDRVDIKKFARAVKSLENTRNLNLVNGTSKPTNQTAIENLQLKESLGSGPYGAYTMSDFFGCMSGLPYPWEKIFNSIKNLETKELYDLYKELFLAVTWESASITVVPESREVEVSPGVFQTEYRVGSFIVANSGGGYYRGNGPAPTITTSNGGSGTTTIGTNDADASSLGLGTFGRVKTATVTDKGAWQTTIPTAAIQAPPTSLSGGTNSSPGTAGWPGTMNATVQQYIDQANSIIQNIASNNVEKTSLMNTYWNVLGGQLKIEQRARYIALSPVPVAKDFFANPYPTSINVFIDSIPNLAQDTRPHMTAQTLEAISNLSTVGGQSTVAQMRQERNQQRLITAGIPLDNNIPTEISNMDKKTLITNNTIPAGINNVIESPTLTLINESPEIYGDITNGVVGFVNPAWSVNEINGESITPIPSGVYVPSDTNLIGDYIPALTSTEGDITPILNGNPVPVVNTLVPASLDTTGTLGTVGTGSPATNQIVTISAPDQVDTNIPSNLDTSYTSSTMLPATYTVDEAIDKVIECNCDCWVE